MRRLARIVLFFAALTGSLLPAAIAAAEVTGPTRVTIPAGGKNAPPTLTGVLYRPSGNGPFPAVVALHGCSGLWSGRTASDLSRRHADWGERLAVAGFVVLFPDSYGSRGLGPQCTVSDRDVSPARERLADAAAARQFLQKLPYVKAGSVALLGWSNGGSTVLYAVRPREKAKDGYPDFTAAVAFYPGCRDPLANGTWQTRIPLMILIGDADDWTPAGPCRALATTAPSSVRLILEPGAYHDFDNPAEKVHEVRGLAFTANGNGIAHAGLNEAARADALRRVPAFLAELAH